MVRKNLVVSALLFLIGFGIVHEYIFALYDQEHSSVSEYVMEIEAPSDHSNLCDIHYEYHISYILPQKEFLASEKCISHTSFFRYQAYDFQIKLNLLKPPIV